MEILILQAFMQKEKIKLRLQEDFRIFPNSTHAVTHIDNFYKMFLFDRTVSLPNFQI